MTKTTSITEVDMALSVLMEIGSKKSSIEVIIGKNISRLNI